MNETQELIAALKELIKERDNGYGRMHTRAVANTNTASLLTQPNGMFAVPGIENEVISTHISPMGLGANLPVVSGSVNHPFFGFVTGFSDDQGAEPEALCDDAPTGYMKGGLLTAQFGLITRQTNTVEITTLLHDQRGVNTDLRLLNTMLNGMNGMDISRMNEGQILDLVILAEMVGVGVRVERKLARMLWQGTIANNTAGGGYKEFPGLDSQIATGQVDAETNTAMPAADSLIYDFTFNSVDGTTKDIVEYLSMMEYHLRDIATRTNMMPVQWAVVMRPQLWFELSAVWPCRYLTHRCADDSGSNPIVINDDNNVAMRDAMRDGMYIDINGNRYPVVVDDGIFEHTNVNNENLALGEYASSIYFVPMTVRGSFPTIYWEHIDYRRMNTQISPMGQGAQHLPFWTDNGRFIWVVRENGFCFDMQARVEPRAVLRTPHLAGKIQSVKYTPLTHLRSAFPDSPYWEDGGTSIRNIPTDYAVWS